MACNLKDTIKEKIVGKDTSFKVKENEVYIPTSSVANQKQTLSKAKEKVNSINKEYLGDFFGDPVSLNTEYENGVGISIHISEELQKASDIRDGKESLGSLSGLEIELVDGFLKDFGITVKEYENLKKDLNLDAYSASNMIAKAIAYQKGESILPEVAYFAYQMLGASNNKIKSDLRWVISSWGGYQQSFDKHAEDLKNREGFIKDSKEWKDIIKDKVILDFLQENLENYYLNPVEFKKQLDKKWTKEDFSLFAKIMKFLEEFLLTSRGSSARKKAEKLKQLGLSIASEIIDRNYQYYNYNLSPEQIKKEYESTINSDAFAKKLVNFGQKGLQLVLTGSLALRMAGSVFRSLEESLHDIDWVVPFSKLEDQKELLEKVKKISEETETKYPFSLNKNLNRERDAYFSNRIAEEVLPRLDWYKNFKKEYPTFTLFSAFVGKDNIKELSSLTVSGVIGGEFYESDGYHKETAVRYSKSFYNKKVKKIKENYRKSHSKGDPIKDTGYAIDFFIRLLPKQEEHDGYFKLWKEIMLAKLTMGREKDFVDWKAFVPNKASADKYNFKSFSNFTTTSSTLNNVLEESSQKSPKLTSDKIIYHGLFVDNVDSLKSKYAPVHPNEFYHHSTTEFSPKNSDNIELGKKSELRITGRLTTNKVDILLVENPKSKNANPHITLSTAEGVKPFESNKEIEDNEHKIQPLTDVVPVTEGYFNGTKNVIQTPLSDISNLGKLSGDLMESEKGETLPPYVNPEINLDNLNQFSNFEKNCK